MTLDTLFRCHEDICGGYKIYGIPFVDIFISPYGNRQTASHSLREEDTLAEVHAVIGGLDVVSEEDGADLGV
jgi:hypothetical protein